MDPKARNILRSVPSAWNISVLQLAMKRENDEITACDKVINTSTRISEFALDNLFNYVTISQELFQLANETHELAAEALKQKKEHLKNLKKLTDIVSAMKRYPPF